MQGNTGTRDTIAQVSVTACPVLFFGDLKFTVSFSDLLSPFLSGKAMKLENILMSGLALPELPQGLPPSCSHAVHLGSEQGTGNTVVFLETLLFGQCWVPFAGQVPPYN